MFNYCYYIYIYVYKHVFDVQCKRQEVTSFTVSRSRYLVLRLSLRGQLEEEKEESGKKDSQCFECVLTNVNYKTIYMYVQRCSNYFFATFVLHTQLQLMHGILCTLCQLIDYWYALSSLLAKFRQPFALSCNLVIFMCHSDLLFHSPYSLRNDQAQNQKLPQLWSKQQCQPENMHELLCLPPKKKIF